MTTRLPTPPETSSDRAGFTGMLPGLDPRQSDLSELERATRRSVAARETAGLLGDLDAALVALAIADARKLDLTIDEGRPSGRAKLIQTMSDVLDALPCPGRRDQRRARGVRGRDHGQSPPGRRRRAALSGGPEGRAARAEHRHAGGRCARHSPGPLRRGPVGPEYEAHERLALMAAHDLDRALTVGAPSGYALAPP